MSYKQSVRRAAALLGVWVSVVFVSQSVLAVPKKLSVQAVSSTQIALEWSDDAPKKGVRVERARNYDGPWEQIAVIKGKVTSFVDSDLSPSRFYAYRVCGIKGKKITEYSNVSGDITRAAATQTSPPSSPTGLSALVVSSDEILLRWNDASPNETGFLVEQWNPSNSSWSQVAATAAGATSFAREGLKASTTYSFRVRATNADGNSDYSGEVSATTRADDSTPEPTPEPDPSPTPTPDPIPSRPPSGFTIPASHPRLWWNDSRLAMARQWNASHPLRPDGGDPLGNAFAYQVTGNTGYARNAIDWLLAYELPAGQVTPWAVGSDNARWDGENAILVYDWCWNQMTAQERQVIIDRWNGYLDGIRQQEWGGPDMPMNNYFWGNLRNELEWGIATYGENGMASSFLDTALQTRWKDSFVPFASAEGKGGVFQEGPGYGAVVGWYPAIPFASLGLMGRNIGEESPFFKEAVFHVIYSTTPAPTARKGDSAVTYELFPFNDSEYPQNGSIFYNRTYYGDFMNLAANQWSNLGVGRYAKQWLNQIQPSLSWHVAAVDAGTAGSADFSSLPLDYYAQGPQYLYARSAWASTSTAVNLILGRPTGVGHAHLDSGSFQIWRNGRWVSRATSGYSQTITGFNGGRVDVSDPAAQNVVLFNGIGELTDSWTAGDPKILRLESTPEYLYVAVDLTPIYRANDDFVGRVPEAPVKQYIREIVFARGSETLYTCDRVDAGSGVVTASYLLHSEQSTPLFETREVAGSTAATRVIDEGTSGIGQFRFEYDYTISGKGFFARSISPVGGADGETVQFDSNLGGTFNGMPFGNGIQKMTITDDGPVWR